MMQRLAIILLLAVSSSISCGAADTGLRAPVQSYGASQKRRALSFWSWGFGHLHPHHPSSSSSSTSGSSSYSSGSDTSSSSGYSSGTSDGGSEEIDETQLQSQYLENVEGGSISSDGAGTHTAFNGWLFLGMALVAVAVGAAVRKRMMQQKDAAQPLNGSKKKRRKGLKKKNQDPGAFIEVATVKSGSYNSPQEV